MATKRGVVSRWTVLAMVVTITLTTSSVSVFAESMNSVKVDGKANIFSAGRPYVITAGDGQGGVMPTEIALPTASLPTNTARVALFPKISGSASTGNSKGVKVGGIEGIAGISTTSDSLVGVFLNAASPMGAMTPTALDFTTGVGSITPNYSTVAPKVGQTFLIDDGMTTGGDLQTVRVPDGATRLFLGFADGTTAGPGGYSNNTGSLDVAIHYATIDCTDNPGHNPTPGVDPTPSPVPEPSTFAAWAMIIAAASLGLRNRRRTR